MPKESLKVVQTRLTLLEYELLRRYASSKGFTIAEALREIVRRHVIEDRVYSKDPIFVEGPVVKSKGVRERTSVEHDKVLYGSKP